MGDSFRKRAALSEGKPEVVVREPEARMKSDGFAEPDDRFRVAPHPVERPGSGDVDASREGVELGSTCGLAEPTGGRTWWAHVEFARTNIAPPILRKRMEDDLDVRAFGDSGEGESLIEVGDQSRRKSGSRWSRPASSRP